MPFFFRRPTDPPHEKSDEKHKIELVRPYGGQKDKKEMAADEAPYDEERKLVYN